MPAPATQRKDNRSAGEIDQIGGISVLWPWVRCAICWEPVPQRHGLALLRVEGRPVCHRCFPIASTCGLATARQVAEAAV